MVIFTNPNHNLTTRFLSCTIIQPKGINILMQQGLENIYIDDYEHNKKYEKCLHFVINPNTTLDSEAFKDLEEGLIDFESFYDYYDIVENNREKRVYIFRYDDLYEEDVQLFINGEYEEMSDIFWRTLQVTQETALKYLKNSEVKFDPKKEIFRFESKLKLIENEKRYNT